jgi:hypothetical protein
MEMLLCEKEPYLFPDWKSLCLFGLPIISILPTFLFIVIIIWSSRPLRPSKQSFIIICAFNAPPLLGPISNLILIASVQGSALRKGVFLLTAFVYLWIQLYFLLSTIFSYKLFNQHYPSRTHDVYLTDSDLRPSDEAHLGDEVYADDALYEAYRDQLHPATEAADSPIQEDSSETTTANATTSTQRSAEEEHSTSSLSYSDPATTVIGLHFAPKFRWRSRATGIEELKTEVYLLYPYTLFLIIYFVGNTCGITHLPNNIM